MRYFCTKFLTGKEHRLDAIIFAHEHKSIGSPARLSTTSVSQDQKERDSTSLATFLITTLLLPALLVAPAERDIRIINVVNPFYAAAAGLLFSPSFSFGSSSSSNSLFLREGHRSLRSTILTRHLQRVLDALPHASQVPKTEDRSSTVPVVSSKFQKSNIIAVSVSPGIGRVDTVSSLLNADWNSSSGSSYLGIVLYLTLFSTFVLLIYSSLLCRYIVLQPLLRIFTKSPVAAIQTVLHVLYLPTPFKIFAHTKSPKTPQGPFDATKLELPEEVLRPGALYAECATVKLKVNVPEELIEEDKKLRESKTSSEDKHKHKGKGKEKVSLQEEVLDIEDDGEYGGELAGRLVWESYERALRDWEKETPPTERDRERERGDKEEKAKAPEAASSSKDEKVFY